MICRAALSLFTFFFISATASTALAQDTKTISAEGVAELSGNGRASARDAAILDGQKRAVEQSIGILIDSQTQIENYQLISAKILSQAKGYIKRYTVMNETIDSELLRIRISTEVSLTQLTDDLAHNGISPGKMRKAHDMGKNGTRSVNITITGLNKAQFAKIKDVLLNQVSGIKDLDERSFIGTTAKISVESINSVQHLSDELLLRDLGGFVVEFMGSTANSLELKVTAK